MLDIARKVNMNQQEKINYRRYMSLCSKQMLHEMKGGEDFSEEEMEELRSLKQDLGGDHQEILAISTSVLLDDVTGGN